MEMLNLSLLKDPIFVLFSVSNFATSLGFYVPYFCLSDRTKVLGMSPDERKYLLVAIGIANTLGRIILGYISDKSWVNRLWVYNVCLVICGVGKISIIESNLQPKINKNKIFSFSNCCICFGGWFSIIGGVLGCIRFYDWRIRWTYFRHFGRFAGIGETYECIRFAVAVPRHRNIHWTTDCWLTLRCFAVVHAWFSICWHHDCSERCDSILHTVITKILCSTADATGKHPNRKRDSIIVLIGLHEAKRI